jgi:hypothetical protein
MLAFAPIRFAALASLAVSASLPAQSPRPPQSAPAATTLPATQPTAAAPVAPSIPLTPSQLPANHAEVTYANGMISVSADNSSLNQILHQISTNTGMKITGGVADERVFGQYGPAAPEDILVSLLDGTGSNMILVHRDADVPPELILTPRHGGATPPNPNAAAASEDRPEPRDEHPPAGVTLSPQEARPSPGTAPPVTPAASTDTSPASSTQPDSPNGVKTPQQIYEQLQRMRQQQQQQTQPQTQPQQTQPQ